jgi:putative endonuclease
LPSTGLRKTIFGDAEGKADARESLPSSSKEKSGRRAGCRHFVYLVRCSDGSLYTGYTTDAQRRLGEHNAGKASKYTRSRRPVTLAYVEELASRGEALKREYRIKNMKKEEKLLLCRSYSGREKLGSR